MNNQGVGAEGLLAAQSVLAADGEDFGNDGRVEHLWVLKAIGDCCVHLSIKLTPPQPLRACRGVLQSPLCHRPQDVEQTLWKQRN